MKTKIVKMGNSSGICIPKIILEQCHMDNVVDIQILEDMLIIKPVSDEEKKNLLKKLEESVINQEGCWYEDETEWK